MSEGLLDGSREGNRTLRCDSSEERLTGWAKFENFPGKTVELGLGWKEEG